MEKVLNQEEIDAMVQQARGGGLAPKTSDPHVRVEPWDARRSGQIGREQLQAITTLHEGFARSLTHSLGAYLRVVFTATLVSAEHLNYREFLQRIPETTYLASCRLEPTGAYAALQLDLKVAFPIIDLLLGGEGKALAAGREITQIDEDILDSVARIICRELGTAWQALSLEVAFEERLEAAEAQRLMPPAEKILSLSFEVTMPDVRGSLILALPVTVSNALLRKISASWSQRRARPAADSRRRVMQRLLDAPFDIELGAEEVRITVRTVTEMEAGSVLKFRRRAEEPASLLVAGVEAFRALPARCGTHRAARVLSLVASQESMPTREKSQ